MKITQFSCYRYKLPLLKQLSVGNETLDHREGLIVILKDETGYSGFGEISPLPGLSKETLVQAQEQILRAQDRIIGQTLPYNNHEKLSETLAAWLVSYKFFPSVQFGFETAVLNLIANRKGVLLKDLITSTDHQNMPICGLLPGPLQDPVAEAEDMLQKGIKAIKLKVGRNGVDEDIRMIQSVSQKIEGKAVLRLDANQRWDISKAVLVGHEIGCAAVEYIEEPFKDTTQYEAFFMKTTIPVALDETLLKMDFDRIKSLSGVDFLVLKPTLVGGITKAWGWMAQAQRVGINTVLSSSFETGVGLNALINLAACSRISYPCGIDTLKWFRADILKDPLTVTHGMVPVQAPIRSLETLNTDYLQKID